MENRALIPKWEFVFFRTTIQKYTRGSYYETSQKTIFIRTRTYMHTFISHALFYHIYEFVLFLKLKKELLS